MFFVNIDWEPPIPCKNNLQESFYIIFMAYYNKYITRLNFICLIVKSKKNKTIKPIPLNKK